ncbi:MAG: transposase, partial [Synergistaceae bacterium]|nr:transposase [Synergistaceae bacterium]
PMEGKIKSVTIEKTPTEKYYASILVENENQVQEVELEKFIGLDFSMHDLYVTSEGEKANYPRFFRKNERKLSRAYRKFSRRKIGSKNRNKARLKVCKIHEKITFQREDFLHRKSYHLAKDYDAVCIETLNVKAMSRTLKFGKSVMDNSYGKFQNMLDYKLYFRGKKLVKISKYYPSSQLCSNCGYKNPETKNLSLREWDCQKCGTHHDRDINAAINIREEGKRTVGYTGSNACGENVRHDNSSRIVAQFSLKQEAPAS